MTDIEYLSKLHSLVKSGKNIIEATSIVFDLDKYILMRNLLDVNKVFTNYGYSKKLSKIMSVIFFFSVKTGYSVNETLKNAIFSIKKEEEIENEIKVITSGSKRTITILKILPLFSIPLSIFLGLNYFELIFKNTICLISLVLGICFLFLGNMIVKKISL